MKKGYVQIYTGDGKGKTTAALGLGLRAVGNGFKVIMVQFLKSAHTSELESVKELGNQFEIKQIAGHKKFFWQLTQEEKEAYKEKVQQAFETVNEMVQSGAYDVFILDEILGAIKNEMITIEQVQTLMQMKPESMEMVLTGRDAPQALIESADLVTEMKMIRHYYEQGVQSRKGIEY
ncbi:cob(I)alamin adenosyltransferase [Natranaerovirga hydrolytica]|uniref:Cob(I)alamin adenosyltransferase n=1 Tax=Natranaerovirga hydrolytica TaxID=680378 RepID=A0A4R1N133_9FIRM|nr:cob(I)yrinic acid a,c-diamide adenosyltransferase [Natranaerovirga hydrolytica]TCK98650.1 cob(I)alamin adenosyltransferase [Natranaerovirga hydrolytica]